MPHKIKLTKVPHKFTAESRFKARPEDLGPKFQQIFGRVAEYLASRGVPFEGPAFAWYRQEGDVFNVRAGFYVTKDFPPSDGVASGELPEVDAAVTTHVGSYDSLSEAYADIQAWAKASGRQLSEEMWEEYLDGPEVAPEKTRTLVVWPIA